MELESLSVLKQETSVNVGELGRNILEENRDAVFSKGFASFLSPAGGAASLVWTLKSTQLCRKQEKQVCLLDFAQAR